jgi:hypothetical protein
MNFYFVTAFEILFSIHRIRNDLLALILSPFRIKAFQRLPFSTIIAAYPTT